MAFATEVDEVDCAQPLSRVLRIGTAEVHAAVESSEGGQWLVSGELDRSEYARLIMMLWHVYDALETALEKHASHPMLSPTYNPALLARADNLEADISYLLQVPLSSWYEHPASVALTEAPPPALAAYVARLEELADAADPAPLLAHAYVRYLGDLSGGQQIRRRLAKSYGLDDGRGLSFYEFKSPAGSGACTIGEIEKIKQWYREGMDRAGGDDAELKAALLKEAIAAFEFNSGLYAALRPPASVAGTETGNLETKVVYQADAPPQEGGSWSILSVVSVVIAMSLAHFLLVVGGFTGKGGSAKLEALQSWLTAR